VLAVAAATDDRTDFHTRRRTQHLVARDKLAILDHEMRFAVQAEPTQEHSDFHWTVDLDLSRGIAEDDDHSVEPT
jgi:hypothetical protein